MLIYHNAMTDYKAAAPVWAHDLPVDDAGYYGRFGGAYIPEILYRNVEMLKEAYARYRNDPEFQDEFNGLLRDYVGALRHYIMHRG